MKDFRGTHLVVLPVVTLAGADIADVREVVFDSDAAQIVGFALNSGCGRPHDHIDALRPFRNSDSHRTRSMNERVNEHGSSSRTIRIVIAALIVAVLIAGAFDNSESVEVGYVIGETEAPVWVVLVAAGIAGVVIGWLIKHRPTRN